METRLQIHFHLEMAHVTHVFDYNIKYGLSKKDPQEARQLLFVIGPSDDI